MGTNDDNRNAPHAVDNPDRVTVDAESNKLNPEFQKFITDESPLLMGFYCAWSGYRISTKTSTRKVLGQDIRDVTEKITIDYNSRIMNESGTNHVFNQIKPLINPLVSTSNLTDVQIYKLWKGKTKAIRKDLLKSYFYKYPFCQDCMTEIPPIEEGAETKYSKGKYVDHYHRLQIGNDKHHVIMKAKNPYDIKIDGLATVTTTLIELYTITSKAKDGFTLKKLADSFITSVIQRNGAEMPKKEGILERIQKGFPR